MLKVKKGAFQIKLAVILNLLMVAIFTINCGPSKAVDKSPAAVQKKSDNSGEQVLLFNDRVSFTPPAGFKTLAVDKLKKKPSENDPPQYVFANDNQTGLILVYLSDTELKPDQLPEVKKFVEGTQRQYSGWLTSEIVEMNGRKWFHFEWETPKKSETELVAPIPEDGETPEIPDKTQYHYDENTTSFKNNPLRFVFQANTKEFPQMKESLIKSRQTIRIKE